MGTPQQPELHRSKHTWANPDHAAETAELRFAFEFDPLLVPAAAIFGITPSRAFAILDEDRLSIRFGRWILQTPLSNVRTITPSGPYAWWKVAGPPRLSVVDRGITFATTTRQGLCVAFKKPVPALLPTSALRHPAATITLESPKAFTDAVVSRTRHPIPTE